MLDEVLLELAEQRPLVGLKLLPVDRGEVERVLVGDVDAGDRDGLVVVHLLRKLAGELDRLHVCSKGTAEDAFEKAFDLGFDGS